MPKELRISFVGPSGSGKTTARNLLVSELRQRGYRVHLVDIAKSLHDIQLHMDMRLGITRGRGEQDDELFDVIIRNHWPLVLQDFVRGIDNLPSNNDPQALVNGDCRDNSYRTLAEAGFRFVRIITSPEKRLMRLIDRDAASDITGARAKRIIERVRADDTKTIPIDWDTVIKNDGSFDDLQRGVIRVLNVIEGR